MHFLHGFTSDCAIQFFSIFCYGTGKEQAWTLNRIFAHVHDRVMQSIDK